ncbi:ABC transporter ATP-binding protein [Paenibacillus hemerocallicola]|uniref:ABC transporter ATP-binding protein n=1 Tax=Paenibacillus hemerocallicola TaxID=1172614 RepID=A0A5C4SZX9_9BACL|nr:ABC transporter ATP-binding protein [Paenibacillus hemerocallicola]TNJ62362.1 ABC transporter ATP-binding protein [Paenibacillus hemerocallicola]
MRTLLPFLKPYRISAAVALSLMLVELVVELCFPLLMAKLIDGAILRQDVGAALKWGGVMIGLALFGFAAGLVNSFYAADVAQGFAHDMRRALFGKLQSMAFSDFRAFSPSSLMTRLTGDINQIQNSVFLGLRVFVRAPLLIAGSMIMALTVDARLALYLVVVTPILVVVLGYTIRKGFRLFRLVQERLDKLNGLVRENLIGMRLIRAYVRGDHEKNRFAETNGDYMRRSTAALRLSEMTVPGLLLLMNASVLLILWFGSRSVTAYETEVGDVVAVLNYAIRITGAYAYLSMIITSLTIARAALSRSAEVLAAGSNEFGANGTAADGIPPDRADVLFEGVAFGYPDSEAAVLDGITFSVNDGETAVIMGATGAGKTSLLQLLPRLYEARRGTVRVGGTDIRDIELSVLRRQIGYVAQESTLFAGTIRDNLLWGREDASMEEVVEAAKLAQIHETIMQLPDAYEAVLEQKGANLSGGQRQRLSIARALLRKPKLLLLDDCTSALDARTESLLLAGLKTCGCTTLLVTQKAQAARWADTVLLLADGKLLAQGKHGELLARSETYRFIVESEREEAAHHA